MSILDIWQSRKYIFEIIALNVLKVKTLEPSQQHYTFIFTDFEHDLHTNESIFIIDVNHS